MNSLISVIVPVYNVEKYLDKCVESIVNQTYKNLEIILVDDGSPDNCPQMCDAWAEKDERIKVIHKQNGGLSDARNYGIDNSTGEYIIFIDSDDYIALDCIEILYNSLLDNNCDMSVGRYVELYGSEIKKADFTNEVEIYTPVEYWLKYYEADSCVSTSCVISCCKLINKKLFADLRFPLGVLNEDEHTTYKLVFACKKIAFIDRGLYVYRQVDGSIMHSKSEIRFSSVVSALEDRFRFFKEHGYSDDLVQKAYKQLMYMLIQFYYDSKYDLKNLSLAAELRKKYLMYYNDFKLYKNAFTKSEAVLYKSFKTNEYVYRLVRKACNIFN